MNWMIRVRTVAVIAAAACSLAAQNAFSEGCNLNDPNDPLLYKTITGGKLKGKCVTTVDFSNANVICDTGRRQEGSTCKANNCTANEVQSESCTVPKGTAGTRSRTCKSDGSDWGKWSACVAQSCTGGYVLINTKCEKVICTKDEETTTETATHILTIGRACTHSGTKLEEAWVRKGCKSGYVVVSYSDDCMKRVCTEDKTVILTPIKNAQSTKRIDKCLENGAKISSETVTVCNTGFALKNGICISGQCDPTKTNTDVDSTFKGGTKSRIHNCSADGLWTGYGDWTITCNQGYRKNGSLCVANTCEPGKTENESCTLTGATSATYSRTCNTDGSAWRYWSSCVAQSCTGGYVLMNNKCEKVVCSKDEVTTTETAAQTVTTTRKCIDSGTKLGAAETVTSCKSGYVTFSGTCMKSVCTQDTIVNLPPIKNASSTTRRDKCTDNGTRIVSDAPVTVCNSGYAYKSGKCISDQCDPSKTHTDVDSSFKKGTRSRTHKCTDDGLWNGYTDWTITCDPGFTLKNGACK
jgi:hypothetical protein